jgi:hypothetical protein
MMPLKSLVCDAIVWSITLDSSIMILEASFTLICDVYRTGITYDDRNVFIIEASDPLSSVLNYFLPSIVS